MIFKCLLILLIAFKSFEGNAQIFSPATYHDCVLRSLEKAKTESAVELLKDACRKKFPPNKGVGLVSDCNLTWNGERFIAGTPEDVSKFIAVRFSQTTSMIYMPEHMDKKLWRKTIMSHASAIKSICPGINFE
jgi:hypothetical protein